MYIYPNLNSHDLITSRCASLSLYCEAVLASLPDLFDSLSWSYCIRMKGRRLIRLILLVNSRHRLIHLIRLIVQARRWLGLALLFSLSAVVEPSVCLYCLRWLCMSLTRDSLSRVRLYADLKIPFVLPFFVVADSMSLDLTVLARLFAVLKLLYVLIFFIICARLKDLRITYFVATLSPLNMSLFLLFHGYILV